MAPFRFDQTKVNSQSTSTQLIVRTGVAQHSYGFSTHEFYLVRTTDINTGSPYDLATDPNFISGSNVSNPNILQVLKAYPVQQTTYKPGGGYGTKNMVNTFELRLQYQTYMQLSTALKVSLIQDQVH